MQRLTDATTGLIEKGKRGGGGQTNAKEKKKDEKRREREERKEKRKREEKGNYINFVGTSWFRRLRSSLAPG